MKRWQLFPLAVLVVTLTGCPSVSSVLNSIVAWTPFGVSVFTGDVSLISPSSTQVAQLATSVGTLVGDVGTTAQAAEAAGSATSGVQKVIAEIQAVTPQVTTLENDVAALGANISTTDKSFISGGLALALSALEGYEAELASQAGVTTASLNMVPVSGECFGFDPGSAGHGPSAWADCDPDTSFYWSEDGQTTTTHPPTVTHRARTLSLDNWKRQFNALARKYGHPEKVMHVTVAESIGHYLTFGVK